MNAGIDYAVNVLKFHFLVCLMLNAYFFLQSGLKGSLL